MQLTRTNALIAAGLAIVNSLLPFLVLIGALDWTPDEVAACYLVVSNVGTFVGLLFASTTSTNVPNAPNA